MSSREAILAKLRRRERPFPEIQPPPVYRPMTPLEGSQNELLKRFIQEAEILSAAVYRPEGEAAAIRLILDLVGEDRSILAWDWAAIPLPGLQAALEAMGISVADPDDPAARVGITGADAALAATGSLVLFSGPGRFRSASLLPPIHIAVIRKAQILPNLERWVERQRLDGLQTFRNTSNIVVISGPSRTSDIAMQPILGMHGPGELHMIILDRD
jgi:L-lactate dehydrogenase complex protein LldG